MRSVKTELLELETSGALLPDLCGYGGSALNGIVDEATFQRRYADHVSVYDTYEEYLQ